jgi:N-acetylmuramoyl-L-alanine amidase
VGLEVRRRNGDIGAVRKEQRWTARGRAEWAGARWLLREEERTTSLSDRQREEMTHRVAAACVTRGVDVGVDRQHRCEVVAAAEQLSRAHETDKWARHFFIY